MSSILIEDLGACTDLDRHVMATVRGGMLPGPDVNVNVNLDQRIGQFQNIQVNVLNGNGVIGADFSGPAVPLSPGLWAMNSAALPSFA